MIILISSPTPQSGKDTVADYLVEKYGFYKVAFADELKLLCSDYFNWNGVKDNNGRKLLIDVAQAAKNIDPNFWAKKTYKNIKDNGLENRDIVVSDFRFEEELWILDQPEFADEKRLIIGVERSDKTPKGVSQEYYSVMDKNIILDNSKDFDFLFKQVDAAIDRVKEGQI
jgi:hypothetical protein